MATDVPNFGYRHCKCDDNITSTNSSIPELGLSANEMSSCGIGCGPHHINTADCKQPDDIPEDCQSVFPLCDNISILGFMVIQEISNLIFDIVAKM